MDIHLHKWYASIPCDTDRWNKNINAIYWVVIGMWKHLFPFRTEKIKHIAANGTAIAGE